MELNFEGSGPEEGLCGSLTKLRRVEFPRICAFSVLFLRRLRDYSVFDSRSVRHDEWGRIGSVRALELALRSALAGLFGMFY